MTKEEATKLYNLVYNWKTDSDRGFNIHDEKAILDHIDRKNLNMDKYYDALKYNTCTTGPHGTITYHCDILTALQCGLENRDMTIEEWD